MASFKKKTPKVVSSASSSSSPFPSSIEQTVASALLLLSDSPPKEQSINCFSSQESNWGWKLNSSGGSISPDTVSFASPVFDESILKVVRKKRTRTIWVSNEKISTPKKPKKKPTRAPTSSDCVSEITTADTTVSSLSCASSIQSCYDVTNDRDKLALRGHIGRQAKSILSVLCNEKASEVRIRQLLGDSPSISKALRVLLKLEKVKRSGAGGRCDPYIYMMA